MRDFFRAMGILLLVVAAGFVVGSIITVFRYVLPAHEFRGIIGLGGIALFLIAVGVGLLKLKKWAALAFSILCLIWGFLGIRQAIEGSIHPVPGSADWLGFVFHSEVESFEVKTIGSRETR